MKKNDYLVVKTEDDKSTRYSLCQALKPLTEDVLLVKLQQGIHYMMRTAEISKENIVVNLGQDPKKGFVYGCDLENLYRKTNSDTGIDLHFFVKTDAATEKKAVEGMVKAQKILSKQKLDKVLEYPVIYEIWQKKSKWAGSFTPGKDNSKIRLFVKYGQVDFSDYIFLHEMAHAMDYYDLRDDELQAKWTRLYISSIKPSKIALAEARSMYKTLKTSDSLSSWKATFDEDTKPKVNLIVKHIKQSHGIGAPELNALLKVQDFESIKSLWPNEDILSSELAPVITEYATKNLKECIAEGISLYLYGTKLPKSVTSLVEQTLALVRA